MRLFQQRSFCAKFPHDYFENRRKKINVESKIFERIESPNTKKTNYQLPI